MMEMYAKKNNANNTLFWTLLITFTLLLVGIN